MNGPSDTARRAGLLAVAGGAAAAVAAARTRFAGRRRAATPTPSAEERSGAAELSTYRCDCGAEYRFSGTDRHRVYWPVDAPEDAPVLGDDCVECGAPLPSGRAARPA